MKNFSVKHRLSVVENFDGEAFDGEDGVGDPKSKTAAPEKIKLLSEHEPEGLARLRVKYAKSEDNNLYKAVREKCSDCCGDSTKAIAECPSTNCPLWKHRFGRHPLPKELSDEQREEMRERAERNFPNNADNDNLPNTPISKGENEQE